MSSISFARGETHNVGSLLPAVWVHAGEEMYPGGVDQLLDLLVPGQVGGADVMSEVEEQLPAQHLVTVHVGDVLHLRLRHLMVAGLVGELQDIERNPLD